MSWSPSYSLMKLKIELSFMVMDLLGHSGGQFWVINAAKTALIDLRKRVRP